MPVGSGANFRSSPQLTTLFAELLSATQTFLDLATLGMEFLVRLDQRSIGVPMKCLKVSLIVLPLLFGLAACKTRTHNDDVRSGSALKSSSTDGERLYIVTTFPADEKAEGHCYYGMHSLPGSTTPDIGTLHPVPLASGKVPPPITLEQIRKGGPVSRGRPVVVAHRARPPHGPACPLRRLSPRSPRLVGLVTQAERRRGRPMPPGRMPGVGECVDEPRGWRRFETR
jgi:hypothetical protein